ncbi:uncharacterized protein LOC111269108 isoform X1 [Varroa jacobsoni]|uniref:uncharacterized protein LOC111269108 isoform X1 n=1 Tax=Varroa jacobsoni TaxID=62625 RepID=UPI000BF88EC4|nr:uncharacterized protein LOC111269108 isoform X1 [Varroa jacobsoni]
MPNLLVEGQSMQSIVAVESLCIRNEDNNSGRMVIASVESLAADVPRADGIKVKSAGQNGNKTGHDSQTGRRRNTPAQSHAFSGPAAKGNRVWLAEVIELSDSDDEVCVTKVEAPKVAKPSHSIPKLSNTDSNLSLQSPVIRTNSCRPVPTAVRGASRPVASTPATTAALNDSIQIQPKVRPPIPPNTSCGVRPGLMPRSGAGMEIVYRNFFSPSEIRASHSRASVASASYSGRRGRPPLARAASLLHSIITQSTQTMTKNANVQNGRALHVLNGGHVQTERPGSNPRTISAPVVLADGKVRQTRPCIIQSPAQVERTAPRPRVALPDSSVPRYPTTPTSLRSGRYTPYMDSPANVIHVPNSTSRPIENPACVSATIQQKPYAVLSSTMDASTRGKPPRITVQSPRKASGISNRSGTLITHRRVTKKEVKNLHLDQIDALVMRYGSVVLKEITLDEIVAKGMGEWKIPKNIKITPRRFPPRQFKAPVALADQIVEISSDDDDDDDDNDAKWSPVRIKREKADSDGSMCPGSIKPEVSETAAPKERLMAGLGLVSKPEANRLRTVRPLKKDIVAVLKDRRTIKRYITCPLVSIVKADCIYKYVLAKRIMRPQAFRCTRQEPNRTTKQKKRRSKSTFLTKLRKKAKPDVRVESAVKNELISANSVVSDGGSDTEIDADFNQTSPLPQLRSSESLSKADIHAMSNINNRAELQKVIANSEAACIWTSFSTAQAQNNTWCPIVILRKINIDHMNTIEKCNALVRPTNSQEKRSFQGARPMERRCCHCRFSCLNMTSLREHFWDSHGIKLSD